MDLRAQRDRADDEADQHYTDAMRHKRLMEEALRKMTDAQARSLGFSKRLSEGDTSAIDASHQ